MTGGWTSFEYFMVGLVAIVVVAYAVWEILKDDDDNPCNK